MAAGENADLLRTIIQYGVPQTTGLLQLYEKFSLPIVKTQDQSTLVALRSFLQILVKCKSL